MKRWERGGRNRGQDKWRMQKKQCRKEEGEKKWADVRKEGSDVK